MPTYVYSCEADIVPHVVEKFFTSFSSAEAEIDETVCTEHNQVAKRVPSAATAMFYGEPSHWTNPSPTKRHSTKIVSQRDGNKFSIG